MNHNILLPLVPGLVCNVYCTLKQLTFMRRKNLELSLRICIPFVFRTSNNILLTLELGLVFALYDRVASLTFISIFFKLILRIY